jgi:hypothetical protein
MSMDEMDEKSETGRRQGRPLDDLSSSHIGKRLRSMYDEVVREPVPDKFMNLLENLERAEKERSNG